MKSSPAEPQIERRRSERIPIRCAVEVGTPTQTLQGVTKNLSATGAMLLLPRPLRLGDDVSLRISLPDAPEPVSIHALVVWQSEEGKAPFASGIHFLLPGTDAVMRIRDLIYSGRR